MKEILTSYIESSLRNTVKIWAVIFELLIKIQIIVEDKQIVSFCP